MSSISFAKYHGAGNDFILIDNREGKFFLDDPDLIRRLCHRQIGIGADGVLLIETSQRADVKMRIYNSDASIPAMCGNGIRCAFDFVAKGALELKIEVAGRIFCCQRHDEHILVNLGPPRIMHWPMETEMVPFAENKFINLTRRQHEFLRLERATIAEWQGASEGQKFVAKPTQSNMNLISADGTKPVYVLDTGVPHALIFVDNILEIPFLEWAQHLRFHPVFGREGVNVNAVQVHKDESVLLRTYERGVEKETLACGTGAAAAAYAAAELYGIKGQICVKTRSPQGNDFLPSLHFRISLSQIEMIGPACCSFTGEFDPKLNPVL